MSRTLGLGLALLLPLAALAVPLQLNHQGHLSDSAGAPLTGDHDITFALHDAASSGNEVWSTTRTLTFVDGYFQVDLGAQEALTEELFDGQPLWLSIAVDTGAPLPDRIALESVPFAIRAGVSDALTEGASIDVSEVRIGGDVVLDSAGLATAVSWDDLTDLPADLSDGTDADSLADLASSCSDGGVPTWSGADWTCASPTPATVDVGTLDGTIDLTNLPMGTGAENVAYGNHGHTAAEVGALPTGTTAADIGALPTDTTAADIGALPAGTTAADIGALPAGTTAADIGALSLSGGTLTGPLEGTSAAFSGGVQVGSTTACSTGLEGTLRWNDGLEVCDGVEWRTIRDSGGLGLEAAEAAPSCGAILADDSSSADGVYWLDPDGVGGIDPFQTWCDMSDGGWALVAAVVSQGPFWAVSSYNSGNSARVQDLGDPTPNGNFVLQLNKWSSLLGREGNSSMLKMTVRRIDNDQDVELGRLQGLQMNGSTGRFTNPNAAWDGFGNTKSATGACVIQYNSNFESTIVHAAFQSGDNACTGSLGWNGSCGYTSLGHNGSYASSGTTRFSHACSLNGNYYCSGDNMTGSGSAFCYFKRKWYWIR